MMKKEQTREKILEKSKEFFIEKGYKDTLIIDIAKSINLDRRTIYRHFDSKEVILLTIVKSMYEDFIQFLDKVIYPEELNAYEKLSLLFDKYSEYFLKNIDILIISSMFDNNLSIETRSIDLYKEFLKLSKIPDTVITHFLTEGILDQSIREDIEVNTAAFTINNALLSLASRIVGHKAVLDIEQDFESWNMISMLATLLLNGIKND